jgi:hypothetical protein
MESGIGCMLTCVVRRFLSPRHCPASLQPQAAPSPHPSAPGALYFLWRFSSEPPATATKNQAGSTKASRCESIPAARSRLELRYPRNSHSSRTADFACVLTCKAAVGLSFPWQARIRHTSRGIWRIVPSQLFHRLVASHPSAFPFENGRHGTQRQSTTHT